jgi:hypothetical protein
MLLLLLLLTQIPDGAATAAAAGGVLQITAGKQCTLTGFGASFSNSSFTPGNCFAAPK